MPLKSTHVRGQEDSGQAVTPFKETMGVGKLRKMNDPAEGVAGNYKPGKTHSYCI